VNVRKHLAVTLVATCVTAWFSYACFHNDEYFQVLELTRSKLAPADVPALPWEIGQRLRPWLQPFLYWTVARALGVFGVRDIFTLAFFFRLLTGLASVGALALFLRTTLPWQTSADEKRAHLRVVTLLGFLPYLFVRTSSETGSMAALTAGWAILLEGASPVRETPTKGSSGTWSVPALARERSLRVVLAGFLFGLAFEMRFQTVLVALGVAAWLFVLGRAPASDKRSVRALAALSAGGGLALALGALLDRWGYGVWTFPPWTYFRVNAIEGAAALFGTSPPFAYVWMLPANVFMPVVLALVLLSFVAWLRFPRHPVTWATLPFFVVHNLISHKEERFLFPIAILSTAFVTMALAPSTTSGRAARSRIEALSRWGWTLRHRWPGKLLAAASFAGMGFLAFVPLGWNHNVRFTRFLHDHIGDELHATVLPEVGLHLPAFHPGVYDVEKAEPEEVARRIEMGSARQWLITDRPVLHTSSPLLDSHATLVFSELVVYRDPELVENVMRLVDGYNLHVGAWFRPLHFRTLYRIEVNPFKATASRSPE
jgi:GPI mannosyltransferase 3